MPAIASNRAESFVRKPTSFACAICQSEASALKAAQIELKRYSAQLAVELAGRKVRERMTRGDQDELVQKFVTELGRQGPTS